MSAKDLRLYFLIQTAANKLKKRADATLIESTTLSTAQTAALTVVAGNEPMSMKDLALALQQRESAMTTMVRRLESKDLVVRERSTADKRGWQLMTTSHGKRVLEKSRTAFAEINEVLDELFDESELLELANSMTKIRQGF